MAGKAGRTGGAGRGSGVAGALTALALAAGLWAHPAAAQTRYRDIVFPDVNTTSDIRYGSAPHASGSTELLTLDLYQPAGDTAAARPLFVFAHGGGFSGGSKTDADMVFLCRHFARLGYVAASIRYRLDPGPDTRPKMAAAVLRAVQDAKAAVRFLRSRKAEYRLDDTRILLGGTSAGGALALQYAYLDPDEVPSYVDTNALGGVEGASGSPGVSSAIRGILNCWGGVFDTAVVSDGDIPVLSVHGTADQVVPYDYGYSLGNPLLVTYGSAAVHRVRTRAGLPSRLKPFPGMGHGFPPGDARVDTMLVLTARFAHDVLYGSGSSGVTLRRDGAGGAAPAAGRRGAAADRRSGSIWSILGRFLGRAG